MGALSEEMLDAGVMLAGEGLHPEIRRVFEAAEFPPDLFAPEEATREEALRERLSRTAQSQPGLRREPVTGENRILTFHPLCDRLLA